MFRSAWFLAACVLCALLNSAIAANPPTEKAVDRNVRQERKERALSIDEPQTISPKNTDRRPLKPAKGAADGTRSRSQTGGWWTTLGGLTFVIALALGIAKLAWKHVAITPRNLPSEVLQVLGRKTIEYRQSIHMVRCGSRILVLGTSHQGLVPLAEITDPVEVDYLAGLCHQADPRSVTQGFSQLLNRFRPEALAAGHEIAADDQHTEETTRPLELNSRRDLDLGLGRQLEEVHG